MPVDSTGRYHMNPQIARMHDSAAKPAPAEAEASPHGAVVVKIEISHQPDGRLHSVTHHSDGHAEEADHASPQEAADHVVQAMGGEPAEESGDLGGGEQPTPEIA